MADIYEFNAVVGIATSSTTKETLSASQLIKTFTWVYYTTLIETRIIFIQYSFSTISIYFN